MLFGAIDFSSIGWAHIAAMLGGALLIQLCKWGAKWLDGKGSDFIVAEMEKLRAKLNENTLMAQIAADDAVIKIMEGCVPTVLHEAGDEVQAAVAAGDIHKMNIKELAAKIWLAAKPQVEGGMHDYIKQSSFKDGQVIAEQVFKRFLAKKILSDKGVVVEPSRADAAAAPAVPEK